jgi:hypothetical protein
VRQGREGSVSVVIEGDVALDLPGTGLSIPLRGLYLDVTFPDE